MAVLYHAYKLLCNMLHNVAAVLYHTFLLLYRML